MNRTRFITGLLAVFIIVTPVMARRADTFLIAYDRWATEDYREQYRNQLPDIQQEDFEARGITDPNLFSGAENVLEFREGTNFDPIGAIFGVINWISDSVGSILGANVKDPYEAKP